MSRGPWHRIAAGALLVTALASCRHADSQRDVTPPASDSPPAESVHAVHIDASMAAAIHVSAVERKPSPRLLRATGKVQFEESRLARVLAPVAGEVTGFRLKVGDPVKKDQTLFALNSRDAAAVIEDHLDAHRDLDLAEKTLAMTQDLFEHQAASRLSLEQAQNDVAKAHTKVDRTEAALLAIGLRPDDAAGGAIDARVPVISPIHGAVIEVHVTDGQYVQTDSSPLVAIADLSEVWVEADVFERDLHLVHTGESAVVTTTAYPSDQFRAHVERVSDTLDPVTRTVKVRFLVSNPTLRLKPEMFAEVVLALESQEDGISVPASALFTEADRMFVYVAIDDHTFTRRGVEAVADSADTRRVLRGLSPGDRVVVSGAVLLRAQEDRNGG
jgi:cobalt-zinc-cadmium efflux system membrane fusion protein